MHDSGKLLISATKQPDLATAGRVFCCLYAAGVLTTLVLSP